MIYDLKIFNLKRKKWWDTERVFVKLFKKYSENVPLNIVIILIFSPEFFKPEIRWKVSKNKEADALQSKKAKLLLMIKR